MTSPYLLQPLRTEAEAHPMTDQPVAQPTPGPYTCHGPNIYSPDGEILATVSNPGSSGFPLVANADLFAASWATTAERDRLVIMLQACVSYIEDDSHNLRRRADILKASRVALGQARQS